MASNLIGQPHLLVRGPHAGVLTTRHHGLRVIEFRPERVAARAEALRETIARLKAEAYQRWHPEPAPAPAPVVCSAIWVERLDPRVPTSARELGTAARRAGWTVRYSYATGYGIESLCVWLKRGGDRARMCYADGRATLAVAWGPDRMITTLTVTRLREWIDGRATDS